MVNIGERRNEYKILMEKLLGKQSCRRLKRRWKDNIKMDLMEVRYEDWRWMELAQDHVQW
jgi:hypothetical protein